jgi:hypothetical protein
VHKKKSEHEFFWDVACGLTPDFDQPLDSFIKQQNIIVLTKSVFLFQAH